MIPHYGGNKNILVNSTNLSNIKHVINNILYVWSV